MKKTFQIIREITVNAKSTKTVREQLLADYETATGVLIVPQNPQTDMSPISLSCKIAQKEVLPQGTDAVLLAYNGNCARTDCMYDFKKDEIPARSSSAELIFSNSSNAPITFNFYFQLENK